MRINFLRTSNDGVLSEEVDGVFKPKTHSAEVPTGTPRQFPTSLSRFCVDLFLCFRSIYVSSISPARYLHGPMMATKGP